MFKKQWAVIDTDQGAPVPNKVIARFWTEAGAKRRVSNVIAQVKASKNPMAYIQLVKLELCYKVVKLGVDAVTEKPEELAS